MKKELSVFMIIIFLLFGCSKTSDKEYLDKASEDIKNGNISEAIIAYEKLVEEYPESDLAAEALVKKAADIFYSVAEKYPKSKQAPQSLFMAGFIYANELQNYEGAKKAYNLFIKKYPGHDLSASAKDELENMGLTPDEILKRKTATSEK